MVEICLIDAVDVHLAGMSARFEDVVFIEIARRDIDFLRRLLNVGADAAASLLFTAAARERQDRCEGNDHCEDSSHTMLPV
jgi:hypothetical protein